MVDVPHNSHEQYFLRTIFIFYWIFADCINCMSCKEVIINKTESILNHTSSCKQVLRLNSTYRFVCFFCEYHTLLSTDMRKHIRKHTGEKPYQCHYCTYKSTNNSNLKSHLRIKHSMPHIFWKNFYLGRRHLPALPHTIGHRQWPDS